MAQAANGPDPEVYLAFAEQLILDMPEGREFVSADILRMMRSSGWPDLAEPRRLGPMLLRLRSRGCVEKIDVRSTPARSHGGVTSVWRRTERQL
ncbi:hypothetical protein [Nocardia sp. NRRL WC-3656]|uniref:hypothetical protein n=1 Tax=Nocardia sp. NRRL WC-3656 TaxID=1463824 RepID=UPI0012DEE71D|nr:hypothetical protein [Nocardia sp. NRRL WC-3656]